MTVEYGRLICVLESCVKAKETLWGKIEKLEAEAKEYMTAPQKARQGKQDAECARDARAMEIMNLEEALAKYPCSDPTTINDDMTSIPCGECPECKALAAKEAMEGG